MGPTGRIEIIRSEVSQRELRLLSNAAEACASSLLASVGGLAGLPATVGQSGLGSRRQRIPKPLSHLAEQFVDSIQRFADTYLTPAGWNVVLGGRLGFAVRYSIRSAVVMRVSEAEFNEPAAARRSCVVIVYRAPSRSIELPASFLRERQCCRARAAKNVSPARSPASATPRDHCNSSSVEVQQRLASTTQSLEGGTGGLSESSPLSSTPPGSPPGSGNVPYNPPVCRGDASTWFQFTQYQVDGASAPLLRPGTPTPPACIQHGVNASSSIDTIAKTLNTTASLVDQGGGCRTYSTTELLQKEPQDGEEGVPKLSCRRPGRAATESEVVESSLEAPTERRSPATSFAHSTAAEKADISVRRVTPMDDGSTARFLDFPNSKQFRNLSPTQQQEVLLESFRSVSNLYENSCTDDIQLLAQILREELTVVAGTLWHVFVSRDDVKIKTSGTPNIRFVVEWFPAGHDAQYSTQHRTDKSLELERPLGQRQHRTSFHVEAFQLSGTEPHNQKLTNIARLGGVVLTPTLCALWLLKSIICSPRVSDTLPGYSWSPFNDICKQICAHPGLEYFTVTAFIGVLIMAIFRVANRLLV